MLAGATGYGKLVIAEQSDVDGWAATRWSADEAPACEVDDLVILRRRDLPRLLDGCRQRNVDRGSPFHDRTPRRRSPGF